MLTFENPRRALILIIETCMSIFGFIVVLTPLALWVSWNELIYFGTLAVCFVGMALVVAFAQLLHRVQQVPEGIDLTEAAKSHEEWLMSSRGVDWAAVERDDPETRRRRKQYGNEAMRELKLVFSAAAILLALGGGMLLLAYYFITAYTGIE